MMRAAAGHLLVEPTGDHNETEQGRIIVVQNDSPKRTLYRGIVLHVGDRYPDECAAEQEVVHYYAYYDIGRWHVVPHGQVIAWGDD